jgi:phosphate:Na+ symporter
VITLFGGLGLFLFGMLAMTDGLKEFAGDRLRSALLRFTGKPLTAFFSGAVATALVQSSSATTLATIGFVSAGMIPFAQTIGILFGASLGTTSTGWLVSVIGMKFSLSAIALPIITVGALLRLIWRNNWRELGTAVAGFGLIFVGINYMQEGMAGLTEYIDPTKFPVKGFWAHLLLIGIGFAMTMLTQSSGASVAITLTALGSGVLVMEQATSMVIGQAIGTTMTALLVSIGGSVPVKRTAVAYVLFNLFCGIIALLFYLPLYLFVLNWMEGKGWIQIGPVWLAAFHTSYILIGVLLLLPLSGRFSKMIERIIKDEKDTLTGNLDSSLLSIPSVALEALTISVRKTCAALLKLLYEGVDTRYRDEAYFVNKQIVLLTALARQQDFLSGVIANDRDMKTVQPRLALLHAIDHMERLTGKVFPDKRVRHALTDPALNEAQVLLLDCLSTANSVKETDESRGETLAWIQRQAELLDREKEVLRRSLLEKTAEGGMQPERTLDLLDAMRWISKSTYHLWRIQNYLYPVSTERAGENYATGHLSED